MNDVSELVKTMKIFNGKTLIECNNRREIYLFGASLGAKKWIESYNINPPYILDNDEKKWGTEIYKSKIIDPQILRDTIGEVYVIVTSMYYNEIAEQLKKYGLRENIDFFYEEELIKKLYLKKNINAKLMPSISENDIEKIRNEFELNNINLEEFNINLEEFNWFTEKYDFGEEYKEQYGDAINEKLLEHYVSWKFLGLETYKIDDIYIDVAACTSPWAMLLHKFNKNTYAIDLELSKEFEEYDYYCKMNATKTTFENSSVKGMSLQCAFEMFIFKDDINFIIEASRILKSGGKVIINPLYMDTIYSATSSVDTYGNGYADCNATEYIRTDYLGIKAGRNYDLDNFKSRIIDTCNKNNMNYKIYYLKKNNFIEENGVYLRFILELTKK